MCIRDSLGGEGIGTALLTVDHAQSLLHLSPQSTQVRSRKHDLSTTGDHIFNDQYPATFDVGTLGETAGAIRLGLLAHERAGQTRVSAKCGHHRDAAHLQAGQHLGASGHQWSHPTGDLVQQDRVPLEPVLVEVLRGSTSGPKRELPGQMGGGMDTASKIRMCHRRSVFQQPLPVKTPAPSPTP